MAPEIEVLEDITAFIGESVIINATITTAHPPVLPEQILWNFLTGDSNKSVAITMDDSFAGRINISEDGRINISEDGRSLHISDVTSEDEGFYQILIWHPAGDRDKIIYLIVEEIPTTEGTEKQCKFATSLHIH